MASDAEDEWKYSIDEVGEEREEDEEKEEDQENERSRRIEPGSMSPENVFFVVLGVLIAVGTLAYGLGVI
ncbi:MAG: hypothetical protein IH933_10715 [Euryarchaeota archaeon]|nr:hypothetical protein [Euryarchaeota archaeon]